MIWCIPIRLFLLAPKRCALPKSKSIPLVGTFHSKFYDDFLQYFHNERLAWAGVNLVIKFFKKCDSVWTVSDSTVETLREYGFDGPITVVPNGTDLSLPEDIPAALEKAEALCHLRSDQPLFVFVGQHIWQKNVRTDFGSRRTATLSLDPDFRLIFVGTGYAAREMQAFIDSHEALSQQVSLPGHHSGSLASFLSVFAGHSVCLPLCV